LYCHVLILAVAGPPRKLGTLFDVWTGRKEQEWDPLWRQNILVNPRIPVLHTPDWDIQWGDERQIGNDRAEGINQIRTDRTPLTLISNVPQTARHPSVVYVDGRTDPTDPNDIRFNNLYNLAMLPSKAAARKALVLFAGYNRAISKNPDLPNLTGYYDMALNVSLKPLMEKSIAPWTTSGYDFPECTSEQHDVDRLVPYSPHELGQWYNQKKFQYCTVERRHICGVCHISKEHAGHEHIPSMDYFGEHKFTKRWRWRLPLDLKIMILGVPQVDWMPTLRDFNLV